MAESSNDEPTGPRKAYLFYRVFLDIITGILLSTTIVGIFAGLSLTTLIIIGLPSLTLLLIAIFGHVYVANDQSFNSIGAWRQGYPTVPHTSRSAATRIPNLPPESLPNLQFVRAGVHYIDFAGDNIIRRISVAQRGHFAALIVFGNEQDERQSAIADIDSLIATITFNDPSNSQIDRACWLYEKSHVIKLNRGSRKELVVGYQQFNGFVCVENDYVRREPIKIKLLRGNDLIADVRLSSVKGTVVTQHHRFKITLEPEFTISRIES